MSEKEFNLFSEGELSDLFLAEKNIIRDEISKKSLQEVKSGKVALLEKYFKRHSFEPIFIDFDQVKKERYLDTLSKYHKSRKSKLNPTKMLFIVYMFPFNGGLILLHYTPVGGVRNWTEKVFIKDNLIGFEKKTYAHSSEDYQEEIDEVIRIIKIETELINNELINYNSSLRNYISDLLYKREKDLKK